MKVLPTVDIEVSKLVPHPENPNVMKDGEFNKLSENIDEIGFAEPIHVALNKDGTYTIIGGEHRYRAASLREIETLPAIVLDDLEEGKDNWENKRRFQLVRLNAIKEGTLDEVEPVGIMWVNLSSVVDFFPWRHKLPQEQK
jgi:ParB/RepB/Spo0J family partition protein